MDWIALSTETNMQISQGVMIVDGTKDEYMDAIRKQIDYQSSTITIARI